jgi:hypothetical protein
VRVRAGLGRRTQKPNLITTMKVMIC